MAKKEIEALVIIHLSSLDSYADIEHEASGEYTHSYQLASDMAKAVLEHKGPVFIVDQGWLFIGRESRPRSYFEEEVGVDYDEIHKKVEAAFQGQDPVYQQHEPRDITWIIFDEEYEDWDVFLGLLRKKLKEAKVDKVVLGGLFFESDLSEGCVTFTYKELLKTIPTKVDPGLVGCISYFYGKDEELPGGYTHGNPK